MVASPRIRIPSLITLRERPTLHQGGVLRAFCSCVCVCVFFFFFFFLIFSSHPASQTLIDFAGPTGHYIKTSRQEMFLFQSR